MATQSIYKRLAKPPLGSQHRQSLFLVVLLLASLLLPAQASQQEKISRRWRVAFAGFTGNNENQIEKMFLERLALDERIALLENAQIQPALKALRFQGAINLSVEEGRGMGSAMGCDFFIIGKTDAAMRSEAANEAHGEAVLGVMLIDSRSGSLAVFDFILEKAANVEAAQNQAAQTLASRVNFYVEKLSEFRAARLSVLPTSREPIEDIPDTESALAAGFKPPEFFNRVKPDYTDAANRADITATVEANVVFKADGEIGDIEMVRWAGFGLDESALRAIRQLKFKPATRDEKAINVRALIRYNFRRVSENEAQPKPKTPEPKPEAKPERDLRQLFKPRYRIPPR